MVALCISNSTTPHRSVTPTICPVQVSLREKVSLYPQTVKVKKVKRHILLQSFVHYDTNHVISLKQYVHNDTVLR